jgi:hypothetical protein
MTTNTTSNGRLRQKPDTESIQSAPFRMRDESVAALTCPMDGTSRFVSSLALSAPGADTPTHCASDGVVFDTPPLDQNLVLQERAEALPVQWFVPLLPVERLDVAILPATA